MGALIAAPAIVKAERLMKVRPVMIFEPHTVQLPSLPRVGDAWRLTNNGNNLLHVVTEKNIIVATLSPGKAIRATRIQKGWVSCAWDKPWPDEWSAGVMLGLIPAG